jgi:hypothetical protein
MIRLLFNTHLSDHQCGFKAFNRDKLLSIIDEVEDIHWFWDTEVLVRGQRAGLRVTEFPVAWRTGKTTTVRLKDVFEMGGAILSLWWQLHGP